MELPQDTGTEQKKRWTRGAVESRFLIAAAVILPVLILIPLIFTLMEQSRETTDLANVRNAYAEVSVAGLAGDKDNVIYDDVRQEYRVTVPLVQKRNGWSMIGDLNVGGILKSDRKRWQGNVRAEGKCDVVFDTVKNQVTLHWDGLKLHSGIRWILNEKKEKLSSTALSTDAAGLAPCSAVKYPWAVRNGLGQALVFNAIGGKTPALWTGAESGNTYWFRFYLTDRWHRLLADSGDQKFSDQTIEFPIKLPEDGSTHFPAGAVPVITDLGRKVSGGARMYAEFEVWKVNSAGVQLALSDREQDELEELISLP